MENFIHQNQTYIIELIESQPVTPRKVSFLKALKILFAEPTTGVIAILPFLPLMPYISKITGGSSNAESRPPDMVDFVFLLGWLGFTLIVFLMLFILPLVAALTIHENLKGGLLTTAKVLEVKGRQRGGGFFNDIKNVETWTAHLTLDVTHPEYNFEAKGKVIHPSMESVKEGSEVRVLLKGKKRKVYTFIGPVTNEVKAETLE